MRKRPHSTTKLMPGTLVCDRDCPGMVIRVHIKNDNNFVTSWCIFQPGYKTADNMLCLSALYIREHMEIIG